MGNLQGTQINKIDGGLGRQTETNDSVVLLVGAVPVGSASIAHNKAVKLIQTKDAENLKINESYDANNKVLAHYHISEVFRLSPNATVIFLPVAPNSGITSVTDKVLQTIKENPEIKGVGYFGFTDNLKEVAGLVDSLQISLVNELKKDGSLKVEILWQELKSAANFLLHINVRYEFETGFIKLRQKGQVSKKDANDLLKQAWNKFYKDSTSDVEEFLPYFKPHFYKTDNYISYRKY